MQFNYAISLLEGGRAAESVPWLDKAAATFTSAHNLSPLDPANHHVLLDSRATVAGAHHNCGKLNDAVGTVTALTTETCWKPVHWYRFACIHAAARSAAVAANNLEDALKHYERAIELLSRAEGIAREDIALIRSNPNFQPFFGDARFTDILGRLSNPKQLK